MRPSTFNRISLQKQLKLIRECADTLLKISRYNLVLHLYQLDRFYVEIFSRADSNEVINIYAFEDVANLDPYLDAIDISELTGTPHP